MSVTVSNPATGEVLHTIAYKSINDIPQMVEAAREAQKKWAKLSFKERAAYIKRIKSFLVDNVDRAAKIISDCTGKLRQDALATEVLPCILACDWYANNSANVLKPEKLKNGSILFSNKTNILTYTPVGVVGIISPWNYPFSIPFGEVLMGLMAGNAVLLKVATQTTAVGNFIEECMVSAELPSDLFHHVVISGSDAGPSFLKSGINKLFFTGSVRVGKELMALAAETLTPLSLELGGNDPMIVLPDACIERAVNCACWAGFQNAGQSCGGVERIYVHQSIYDEFLEQLISKTRSLRHGPDTNEFDKDIGSITTVSQFRVIESQVREALEGGAKIEAHSTPVGDVSKGLFYPATVLTGVKPDMRIVKEETFGPVLPVIPFEDENDAIRWANDCSLALTSSVFSASNKNAMRIANQLESGVVTINDHLYSHGISEAPWGGWKESGLGRTHGVLGLKEMCNVRCINSDSISSRFLLRNLWWFPFSKDSYNLLIRIIQMVAGRSILNRVKSFFYVLTNVSFMLKPWKPKK